MFGRTTVHSSTDAGVGDEEKQLLIVQPEKTWLSGFVFSPTHIDSWDDLPSLSHTIESVISVESSISRVHSAMDNPFLSSDHYSGWQGPYPSRIFDSELSQLVITPDHEHAFDSPIPIVSVDKSDRLECLNCGRRFSSKQSLKRHSMSSTACPAVRAAATKARESNGHELDDDKSWLPKNGEKKSRPEASSSPTRSAGVPPAYQDLLAQPNRDLLGITSEDHLQILDVNLRELSSNDMSPMTVHTCVSSPSTKLEPIPSTPEQDHLGHESLWQQGIDMVRDVLWRQQRNRASAASSAESEGFFSESDLQEMATDDGEALGVTDDIPLPMLEDFRNNFIALFHEDRATDAIFRSTTNDKAPGSTSASGQKRPASAIESSAQDSARPSKRTRLSSDRYSAGDGNDENEEEGPSRKAITSSGQPEHLVYFACPYAKWKPESYAKCFSHVFKTVSRVKQHLRLHKNHRIPMHCPRCFKVFENENNWSEHIRPADCELAAKQYWEGVTEKQRERLSKSTHASNSSREAWFEVWDILFPGVDKPSSPYIDMSLAQEIRVLREYFVREGRFIWNNIVASRLSDNAATAREEIQHILEFAFPDVVTAIFSRWQNSQLTSTVSSSPQNSGLIPTTVQDEIPISQDSTDGNSLPLPSVLASSPTNSLPLHGLAQEASSATTTESQDALSSSQLLKTVPLTTESLCPDNDTRVDPVESVGVLDRDSFTYMWLADGPPDTLGFITLRNAETGAEIYAMPPLVSEEI